MICTYSEYNHNKKYRISHPDDIFFHDYIYHLIVSCVTPNIIQIHSTWHRKCVLQNTTWKFHNTNQRTWIIDIRLPHLSQQIENKIKFYPLDLMSQNSKNNFISLLPNKPKTNICKGAAFYNLQCRLSKNANCHPIRASLTRERRTE